MDREIVDRDALIARARELREAGWWFVDLTAVDRLHLEGGEGPARFEVVTQFVNHETKQRLMLRVIAAGDPPTIPSITEIWPAANAYEREVFDLFGVSFEGHPDLTRIMLPDEWEGHPLRKDYGVGKVTVQYLPQPFFQVDTPGQGTSTLDSDEDADRLGQAGPPERIGG
ncbi:MAG TPA: NADH-quinone oxidoreductase subunit C [Actinomycetota bacterium]|nr:NADH-quinone oxidoreductase subunit C [Actinomycetota bacterium]